MTLAGSLKLNPENRVANSKKSSIVLKVELGRSRQRSTALTGMSGERERDHATDQNAEIRRKLPTES